MTRKNNQKTLKHAGEMKHKWSKWLI